MYTVARFGPEEDGDIAILKDFGRQMNEVIPGFYTKLHRVHDEFSGTVASADKWVDHVNEVIHFLDKCQDVIRSAYKKGITVQLDAALGPEDYEGRTGASFMLPSNLMERMATLHVTFVFSVY